jgi:hypothetical protein
MELLSYLAQRGGDPEIAAAKEPEPPSPRAPMPGARTTVMSGPGMPEQGSVKGPGGADGGGESAAVTTVVGAGGFILGPTFGGRVAWEENSSAPGGGKVKRRHRTHRELFDACLDRTPREFSRMAALAAEASGPQGPGGVAASSAGRRPHSEQGPRPGRQGQTPRKDARGDGKESFGQDSPTSPGSVGQARKRRGAYKLTDMLRKIDVVGEDSFFDPEEALKKTDG